jgi:hypothetical protein
MSESARRRSDPSGPTAAPSRFIGSLTGPQRSSVRPERSLVRACSLMKGDSWAHRPSWITDRSRRIADRTRWITDRSRFTTDRSRWIGDQVGLEHRQVALMR